MVLKKQILFIQYRATLAGAQVSLRRLVTEALPDDMEAIVLLAEEGPLSEQLKSANVRTMILKWPSPRSTLARLGGLSRFAKKTISILKNEKISPSLIIANDHQECPIALELSKSLRTPSIALLRSSNMSQRDFDKYRCAQISHLFAVGADLTKRVSSWSKTPLSTFNEGFTQHELKSSQRTATHSFPSKILVIGTQSEDKGFSDFLQALNELESKISDFPALECVFTSSTPTSELFTQILQKPFRSKLTFNGRTNDLQAFAQNFDFAVHPSRRETFGMAPLEVILAGTPTLCTATGVLDSHLLPPSWLVPTNSPSEMAKTLKQWFEDWPRLSSQILDVQTTISDRYSLRKTSKPLFKQMKTLSKP